MLGIAGARGFGRPGHAGADVPVELRFVDLLLIIIATLTFLAVLLGLSGALAGSGHREVAPRVATTTVPTALTRQTYQLTLAASGGDGAFSWQVTGGHLPAGLALHPDGVVTGVPSGQGSEPVTVQVRDGQGRVAAQQLLFSVRPVGAVTEVRRDLELAHQTVLLPSGQSGVPYRYDFQAGSGVPPYTWAMAGGKLPDGVSLTRQGALVGSPGSAGDSTFTVRVTDSAGAAVTQQVRLTVDPAPPSFWDTVLTWLWRLITWFGYFLVFVTFLTIVFGAPPSQGNPGLIHRFRRNRYYR
ncbi:Ig domain-containing protein [Amycolatopsis alkalitolerans]|uniref:Dystroglycan-type cadherin-like domain-containing protein n=1 Tax=Amycolatopsis alkalitolerans TaxID=2547244 RepID=A0A5C4LQ12_9PSEU|nr:Ig domain-containing protein [Amycolatopsis alkalitolerans]TNC20299.1 hypothetical protein FG385_31050 [Amycolatopsis alkalitolerans]